MATSKDSLVYGGRDCACNGFLKVNNTLYNMRYVKTIECNDQVCKVVFANTENTYFSSEGTSYPNRDKGYECNKDKRPECYKKLRKFVDSNE
jgi:hypothetical protein